MLADLACHLFFMWVPTCREKIATAFFEFSPVTKTSGMRGSFLRAILWIRNKFVWLSDSRSLTALLRSKMHPIKYWKRYILLPSRLYIHRFRKDLAGRLSNRKPAVARLFAATSLQCPKLPVMPVFFTMQLTKPALPPIFCDLTMLPNAQLGVRKACAMPNDSRPRK